MLERRYSKANSGSSDTVRRQTWHRWRRTRIDQSSVESDDGAGIKAHAGERLPGWAMRAMIGAVAVSVAKLVQVLLH